MSTQDFFPGGDDDPTTSDLERRGRLPKDLLAVNLDMALQELYYRFKSKTHKDEMSTPTLARIIKDLAGLQMRREEGIREQVPRSQVLNVLALVDGIGDKTRQLQVLKQALEGAERPEEIEAAIVELEGAVNGSSE